MADAANEAELGRSKHSSSPAEHLLHLLNLGWDPGSPLIQRFVANNLLQRELSHWMELAQESDKARKPAGKGKK
jgi:hypothetical protein